VFLFVKRQKKAVVMKDGIVMEHLSVDLCVSCDESGEVAEVRIGDVDHGSYRKDGPLMFLCVCLRECLMLLFHIYFFYTVNNRIKLELLVTPDFCFPQK
jgi:hypothetical protein